MSVRDTSIRSRTFRSFLKAVQSCEFGGFEQCENPRRNLICESLQANGRIFLNSVPDCASDTALPSLSVERKTKLPVIRERKSSALE